MGKYLTFTEVETTASMLDLLEANDAMDFQGKLEKHAQKLREQK